MFEPVGRLAAVVALVALVAGCASATAASPPVSSDTGARPSGTEGPSNFASPTDLLHRYPTMRRQDL
jgi:hypothetical protein